VPATEYSFPPQYKAYATENVVEESSSIPGRPLSYVHQGSERFEEYREHRRSLSDSGDRPVSVPIMHVPEHGESFELESRGRSPR
jgi:hypothetical protein